MPETIKEFLVGLSWRSDETQQRRFVDAIQGATLNAKLLGDAIENSEPHRESGRDSFDRKDILPSQPTGDRTGYLMIESATIQNFRGFKHVELSGLARINIIVGDNGAGKTAILEALFMASAPSPEVALRLKNWRGSDASTATGTPQEISDGFFLDLFNNFDKDISVSIDLTGNAGDSRLLRFYYDRGEPTLLPLTIDGLSDLNRGYIPVTFEWKRSGGQSYKVTPRVEKGGIQIPPAQRLAHDPAFLAARSPFPTTQNARWFSDFSKWGKETRFVSAVKEQFDIESLNVEVDLGNSVIWAKLPWLERKMPLYLASDGLNKLVTLLLHIAHSENTALFVDEIESGFHHSRHTYLWKQLLWFAKEYGTQLFVSTHSLEFLEAVAPIIEESPGEFAIVQVSQERGVGNAIVVPGGNAAAAIETKIDVRR